MTKPKLKKDLKKRGVKPLKVPSKKAVKKVFKKRDKASKGTTNKDIAQHFGVSIGTITKWCKLYPNFVASLKTGKAMSDDSVEASLFQRAIGYSCPEEKVHVTKEGEVIKTIVIKHYPPDPTSMIFWLKNRRRKEWTDTVRHTGADGESPIALDIKTRSEFKEALIILDKLDEV